MSRIEREHIWDLECPDTKAGAGGSGVVAVSPLGFGHGNFHKNSRKMGALRNACSKANISILVNQHLVICQKV